MSTELKKKVHLFGLGPKKQEAKTYINTYQYLSHYFKQKKDVLTSSECFLFIRCLSFHVDVIWTLQEIMDVF